LLFLNAALLIGLLGIGIPVLLHLFSRKSADIIPWGAMRFLQDSLAQRTRKIQLEDALLMATRCLLFGCLALAIARPFSPPGSAIPYAIVLPLLLIAVTLFGCAFALWQSNKKLRFWFLSASILIFALCAAAIIFENQLNLRRLTGAGQTDVALVIDASTSMTINLGDGSTSFDHAIDEAREIVMKSGKQSAFSIILAGPVPVVVNASPSLNRSEIDRSLTKLEPIDGEARLKDAVAEASRLLETGNNPSKQIIVLTDGQNRGWQSGNASHWDSLNKEFAKLPHAPRIAVRQFSPPTQIRNLALTNLEFSRDVIGVDRDVDITLTIENTGTESVTPSAIQLQIGRQTINADILSQLAPGASDTIRFSWHFKEPGAHAITASVRVADDIQIDNTFSTALTVIGKLKVLLVDGNPSSRFFDRATAFVETALAPGLNADAAWLVEPVVMSATQIVDNTSFSEYQAIILCDVPQLPARVTARLDDYVKNTGGGLIVATGQRADQKFYQQWQLLPGKLEKQITAQVDQAPVNPVLGTFDHHALRKVADSKQSDFSTVNLTSYWQLTPAKDAHKAAALTNGDPFVLTRSIGNGTVIQIGCSLDTRSGTLPTRQAFVPFIHELTYYLANPEAFQLNLTPSTELSLTLKRESGSDSVSTSSESLSYPLITPIGEEFPVNIITSGSTLFARFTGVPAAGIYEIRVPARDQPALATLVNTAGTIPFTVIRPAGESTLNPLTDQDFAFMNRYVEVLQPKNSTDILTILAGKSFGEELWKYLAIAALFLLVAEVALTRWIATNRKTGDNETVTFHSPQQRQKQTIDSLRTP
jgi:hypothetical protein